MRSKYISIGVFMISIACSKGIAHRSEKASKNSGWLDFAKDKIALALTGAAALALIYHQYQEQEQQLLNNIKNNENINQQLQKEYMLVPGYDPGTEHEKYINSLKNEYKFQELNMKNIELVQKMNKN